MGKKRTVTLAQQLYTGLHRIKDEFAQSKWIRQLGREEWEADAAIRKAKRNEIRKRLGLGPE